MLNDCLTGIRVLDLSQYLPGPYATQLLADLGAEVLKVEPPGGDPMRAFILCDSDGLSPWYKQVNAGKQVVQLDLKTDEGRRVLEQLAAATDVLLESFRPGVMERLGFSRERLDELNPGLVHCALSGFGQHGPDSQRAGHDLTYLAASGLLSLIGSAETPVIPFPPISDYAAGKQAATAILAALLRKTRTGQGAFIDVSLFETVLAWQSFGITAARRGDQTFRRGQDLLTGGAACYQIYRTADDRFVVLGAIEEKFWQAFCRALERPEWIDRQHEPLPQRQLIGELQSLFATLPQASWEALLQGTDCCFEPVRDLEQVAEQPQVRQRRLLQEQTLPEAGVEVLFPAWVDDQPPPTRPRFRQLSPKQALAGWCKG